MYQVRSTASLQPPIFTIFVLVSRLGAYEQIRREHHAQSADSLALIEYGCYEGFFSMNQREAEEFACRFRLPLSIVAFNLRKLGGICNRLLADYAQFRREYYGEGNRVYRRVDFNSRSMAILLEFYLQIDGRSSVEISVGSLRCLAFSRPVLHEDMLLSGCPTTIGHRRHLLWSGRAGSHLSDDTLQRSRL